MAAPIPSLHNSLGFLGPLHDVKPHSLENKVHILWGQIVMTFLTSLDGYNYFFNKGSTPANDHLRYITTINYEPAQNSEASQELVRRQILLVECKRPSMDTPANWDNTIIGQFENDFSNTPNHSERLFGAVAIGRKVRFYKIDGKAPPGQKLVQLHQDAFDMDTVDGITQVENMMNYIKANRLQWVRS